MNKKILNKYILGAMILAPSTAIINNNSSIVLADTISYSTTNAENAVELAETTPTIENIQSARELVNALPEGQDKNDLQDRLNAISNVENLEFNIGSASANVDIYIKCENMLSLSLSTNSVTFEDFNGTEDMEKNNAVTLTVNSSLPYDVNSYLPVEIKGSENNNTMDLDILEIKANGESTYKKFSAIGSNEDAKLNLLSNQIAGNDKTHGIDLRLVGGIAHEKDVYKTTIKFEVSQK